MTPLVIDASVGVKWLVNETHTADALRLQGGGFDLHVPGLFDVEIAAVLWKKHRRGEITREDAERFAAAVGASPLTRHPDRDLVPAALAVAVETGRTVYDSVYLALADRLGCRLVTADERFRNALLGTRWEPLVLWVADVP
jgi:predicted nucleic acid-binding protein